MKTYLVRNNPHIIPKGSINICNQRGLSFDPAIKLTHENLKLMPCFAIRNDSDCLADVLLKSSQFNQMTALDRARHGKNNQPVSAAPHDVVFKLFSIDSRTRDLHDVNKWPKF